MRKYLFIIKTQIMTNLQYIFNITIGFIGYFIMLFILFNLWRYLYSDPSKLINGYNMEQMTWYVIITEILWSTLGGRKFCTKISNDVKSGNVAYNINKPYNYILYCLSTHIGDITIKAIVYTIIGMLTGLLFLKGFPNLNILSILVIIISGILATVISILILTCIGLVSFFIEDSSPLYWVYSKIILVLGTIFPIEYFPKIMQTFLYYSPVYVVCYGPARLFVSFNWMSALKVILAQLIYIALAYCVCYLIYQKGVKKINVNGG
jgi:ABC-2 type transport system permease protein